MCLAFPGKVEKVEGGIATVDFGGIKREVSLELLSDITVGKYVLVHAGYAIQTLNEERALESLRLLKEMEEKWSIS